MMRAFLTLLVVVSTVFGGFSLAAAQSPTPATSVAADPNNYPLGVSDKVKVTVFNEPTLSGTFAINADGAIAFPLIGNTPAVGKSPEQLRQILEQRLGDGYLREPRVTVEVLTFRPFYIYGEVNNPGEYPYTTGLTVLNAVALAKGFTYRADKRKILLKRAGQSSSTEVRVGEDTEVFPGDTIRIAERYF